MGNSIQACHARGACAVAGDGADRRPGRRPDGIFRRVGAGAGRGQHRQSLSIGEFVGIPMSRAGSLRRSGLGRVPSHAARMAVPAARRHVHFARTVAGRASGRRSIRSRARSPRGTLEWLRSVDNPVLHGRPAASVGDGAAHLGRVFDRRVDRRHAEDHDDAPQGGVLQAQRRDRTSDRATVNSVPGSGAATT